MRNKVELPAKSPRNLADELRSYVAGLIERIAHLKREKAELSAERERLLSAALNLDDTKQFILDYIDSRAKMYAELCGWRGMLDKFIYPPRYPWPSSCRPKVLKPEPMCLRDVDDVLNGNDIRGPGKTIFDGGPPRIFAGEGEPGIHSDYAWYFFFGDAVKQRVEQEFSTYCNGHLPCDVGRIGPPVRERRERIAAIDARLMAIDEEVHELSQERDSLTVGARS